MWIYDDSNSQEVIKWRAVKYRISWLEEIYSSSVPIFNVPTIIMHRCSTSSSVGESASCPPTSKCWGVWVLLINGRCAQMCSNLPANQKKFTLNTADAPFMPMSCHLPFRQKIVWIKKTASNGSQELMTVNLCLKSKCCWIWYSYHKKACSVDCKSMKTVAITQVNVVMSPT